MINNDVDFSNLETVESKQEREPLSSRRSKNVPNHVLKPIDCFFFAEKKSGRESERERTVRKQRSGTFLCRRNGRKQVGPKIGRKKSSRAAYN